MLFDWRKRNYSIKNMHSNLRSRGKCMEENNREKCYKIYFGEKFGREKKEGEHH